MPLNGEKENYLLITALTMTTLSSMMWVWMAWNRFCTEEQKKNIKEERNRLKNIKYHIYSSHVLREYRTKTQLQNYCLWAKHQGSSRHKHGNCSLVDSWGCFNINYYTPHPDQCPKCIHHTKKIPFPESNPQNTAFELHQVSVDLQLETNIKLLVMDDEKQGLHTKKTPNLV